MEKYDLIVLGAGPGGYVAAISGAQAGLKTLIVDRRWLGGVCLNVGCIPSKALLKNAEVAHLLREKGKDFGFSFQDLTLDYAQAVKRSRQVSDRLTKGVGFLMKKNNIEVMIGEAVFESPKEIRIKAADGTMKHLQAENIIIATGSSTINLPGMEPDGKVLLTYQDAILQETLPGKAIIIGGGAIGVEFATIWNAYGSEVTIVEMLPHVLPLEDDETAAELARAFHKKGIKILADTRVESIQKGDNSAEVFVRHGEDLTTLEADQVLMAVGFKPNTTGLDLEKAGIALSPRGHVIVDGQMATNVDGVWAIGDVTGKLLLAHVASAQALVCIQAMTGGTPRPLEYSKMPRVTYCQPQVASFGMTEQQVNDSGIDSVVAKYPFLANGKSLGIAESTGFVKIIAERSTGKILGAHLIGSEVAELLPELTLAEQQNLTIKAIASNTHAHPTLSEAIQEVAHALEGKPIHI